MAAPVTAPDVKPSIPRTPAQVTLRVVSVVMAILGAVVLLGAVLVFWYRDALGLAGESMWTVFTYGGIILAAAVLLLATAWLGLRAADDSSRVGPYRGLCYFVGLVILVAIVWGWGMGMFLLFNPVVLASTVTYVLVCSQLADRVADEHERGVRGEVFLRTGHQRTLHLLAEVVLVKGALVGAGVAAVLVALLAQDAGVSRSAAGELAGQLGMAGDAFVPAMVGGFATAGVNLALGALGIYGSNRPSKVTPFLAVTGVAFAFDLVKVVAGIVATRSLTSLGIDVILDLLYTGACFYLALQIRRQPAELTQG